MEKQVSYTSACFTLQHSTALAEHHMADSKKHGTPGFDHAEIACHSASCSVFSDDMSCVHFSSGVGFVALSGPNSRFAYARPDSEAVSAVQWTASSMLTRMAQPCHSTYVTVQVLSSAST